MPQTTASHRRGRNVFVVFRQRSLHFFGGALVEQRIAVVGIFPAVEPERVEQLDGRRELECRIDEQHQRQLECIQRNLRPYGGLWRRG